MPDLAQVCRAREGDRAAFDDLAKRYRPLLFALAFLRTSHKEEAEDLVQSVLANAWRKLSTLGDAARFLPWLKTVMANACNSWYRGSRVSLSPLDEEERLPADKGSPLESLLNRERRREIRRALLTLPDANRLALLMHVWGDASYSDIAAFTSVPVSTVDGRIYRAKRQLRRLLYDSGAVFLGDEPRPVRPAMLPDHVSRKRRRRMQPSITTAAPGSLEQPLSLLLFTRRFSLLLDASVPLLRALDALHEMPPPYGEAARELHSRVQHGEHLSQAMAARPDLFPPVYIAMIRAGEVGGVLEETVQRLKKVLEREWKLANRHPLQESPLFLLLPSGQSEPIAWDATSSYHRSVLLSLFFGAFGMMLQSGVPIVLAMRTATALLPAATQDDWVKAIQDVVKGVRFASVMEQLGIFPLYALELIRIGEESGSLDSVFHRLSESFEDDLDYEGAS